VQKISKILIIRFSSIGDIILTTPVVRCLKLQTGAEVHYLTKSNYLDLVSSNPHIDKVYAYNTSRKVLKEENYDVVVDLHNNIRSFWIKKGLGVPCYNTEKEYWNRLLFIYFGINKIENHVVDRYFNAIRPLNIFKDKLGLEYYNYSEEGIEFDFKKEYFAWCIGASYDQKKLSAKQVIAVSSIIEKPIVLLGSKAEYNIAEEIIAKSNNNSIYNFCGALSLAQSSYFVKQSSLLLTNDTGLMHIGAAFKIPTISFWGCTKPDLGFSQYRGNHKSIEIISAASKKACSKHGSRCSVNKKGCVKLINPNEIFSSIEQLGAI